MKKRIKRKELANLFEGLKRVITLEGAKFSYAVVKNVKNLSEEIDKLNDILKPSAKYDEWQKKRVELCEKYAEKDKQGKPVIERTPGGRGQYKGLDNNKEFKDLVEKLEKEYIETSNERKVQFKNYEKALEEEIEVDIYVINKKDIPEKITPGKLLPIMLIVEGE